MNRNVSDVGAQDRNATEPMIRQLYRSHIPRKSRNERGFILIGVLWGAALITVMAGGFVYTMRTETQIAYNILRAEQARALADGGVFLAIDRLRAERNNRAVRWNGVTLTETIPTATAPGVISIQIQDKGGKVDLNGAAEPLLRRLLLAANAQPDIARSVAAAIVDWRDRDDIPRDGGAEAEAYRFAGKFHTPANAPFSAIDEARHVLGMTDALFARLQPGLTVHARKFGVDPSVAVPLVAAALALPPPDARALSNVNQITSSSPAPFRTVRRFFGVSARTAFTVDSTGVTADGAKFTRTAIIGIGDHLPDAYAIYAWR